MSRKQTTSYTSSDLPDNRPICSTDTTFLATIIPDPHIVQVSQITQGKTSNLSKLALNLILSTGNGFRDHPSPTSPNIADPVFASSPVAHVGSTAPEVIPHGHPTARVTSHLNPGAVQEPDECRLNPTGTLPLVLPTERRKARTIQNLPEALRQQVTATPERFHDMILQAYNKFPRRLVDILHRHVRFNPPSGRNIGENLLWLLECAAAGTPIFEEGSSWISQGGRGVFRTKYCVRLPKSFRIPLEGHFPSAPVTNEQEADAIFMGRPIVMFWGGPDNVFICSREIGGPAVLGHLMNTPVRHCKKGDATYLARVTPEGLASNQDLSQPNCSFVNNPRCPQVRVRDSYTAPPGSEYGVVCELLVGYGNAYDV